MTQFSNSSARMTITRPHEILDGSDAVAAEAWQAFNAMETTKRRHFDCLEILDEKKKKFNLNPTDADTQRLACLLQDHDVQVKRFTKACEQLKRIDAAAHQALFVYIGAISAPNGTAQLTH